MCKRVTILEFEAVWRMLEAGARHVEIARELDLSVSTIARIADDRRQGRYPLMSEEGVFGEAWQPSEEELPEDDAPPDYVASNLRRCPGCGAMVYVWPCLACRLATTERLAIAPEEEEEDDDEDVLAELIEQSEHQSWRRAISA
jgi:hypothetical protein